jgi:ATP/maltotriose-dependent transcriptional regulator MalT
VLRGPAEEAREISERAVAAARASGSRTVEAHALDTLGMAMSLTGDWAGGEQALREAIRIARELPDDFAATRASISLGDCLEQQGRIEEAAELALEGASMAERAGVLTHARYLTGDACWRFTCLGRLDEAEAIAERALATAPKGMPGVLLLESAAHLALRLGRLDDAEERFGRVRDMLGETRDSMWLGTTASGQAEVALSRADPDAAWSIAIRVLEVVDGREYVHYTARLYATALRAAADRALRAQALGAEARAAEARSDGRAALERLRSLLAPERWHDGAPGPEPVAFEAVCVAELARAEARSDPAAWDAAAARFAALGEPFEQAYARWRQGEALIAGAGDADAARSALREAAGIAAALPAPLLAAEIEGLARRARVPLDAAADRPAEDVDRFGLTQRERAVLALVTEGRTNREIGEALFISDKTASVHVSRILAKLGVRSRVEAATAAHRLGLV